MLCRIIPTSHRHQNNTRLKQGNLLLKTILAVIKTFVEIMIPDWKSGFENDNLQRVQHVQRVFQTNVRSINGILSLHIAYIWDRQEGAPALTWDM